jgi:periplasmic protein TonB
MAPAIARPAGWLVSTGLHAIGFIAMGRALAAPAPSSRPPSDALVVEIATDSLPEAGDSSSGAPGTQLVTFVPPSPRSRPYPAPSGYDARPHVPALVPASLPAFAPSPAAAVAAPARFTMVVTSDPASSPPGSTSTSSGGDPEPGSDSVPLPERSVSSPARLATPISPVYPASAIAQEVEADVVLVIVVTSKGDVASAQVVEPAGFGFDDEALRAVRAARFSPALRAGRRVAVRMRWSVSFRLR